MTNYTYQNNRYIKAAYKSVIYLALMYHILFACLIVGRNLPGVFIYYLGVCVFYVMMVRLIAGDHYQSATVLVHLEIMVFMVANTLLFGWNAGFHAYLLALASLVYFNPFANRLVMYFFSGAEAATFFLLKLYTMYTIPLVDLGTEMRDLFYLINYAGCFLVVVAGAAVSKFSADNTERRLERKTRSLQSLADHDTLTHLWTRSYLMKQFQSIRKKGVPFSVVMCDIDSFKKINDTYGHNCGDYILENVASIIQNNSPENSIVTRWGGEEFIVLLEDCDITRSKPLVENIRREIDRSQFTYKGQSLHVTVTFGISTSMEQTDLTSLIELADTRMYIGKQNGKNTVVDDSYVI